MPLWHSNIVGSARMSRAILALKFGQWHSLRAKMARAILALPTIFECQNGSSHSGTQIMHPAVPEWFGPFWHSSYATGRGRMVRAILALKSWNLHGRYARKAQAILSCKFGQWHYLRAEMARAILALPTIFECHNGLSHSGTQVM